MTVAAYFGPVKKYQTRISISQWADDDKPREKLLLKGKSVLSDAELLAILIRSGSRENSAVELAKQLLQVHSNDLNSLARSNVTELMKISGIGLAKAAAIVSALELGRRRKVIAKNRKNIIRSSQDVHECVKDIFFDLPFEEFWILILNRSNEVLARKRISQGGVSGTVADNKLIFKYTLDELGSSLIVLHNHPSGNLTPSKADEELTRKIKKASENLDIQLLDHLIVFNNEFFSFADEGLL